MLVTVIALQMKRKVHRILQGQSIDNFITFYSQAFELGPYKLRNNDSKSEPDRFLISSTFSLLLNSKTAQFLLTLQFLYLI